MVSKPIWPNGVFGVPQITPYTTRDAHSLLELIKALRDHVVDELHPNLQTAIDKLVADVEAEYGKALDRYVDGVQEFQRIHDAFMSDVNASLMALNDGAVSDLVRDDGSMLGRVMREIFADKAELTDFRSDVDYRIQQHIANTDTRFGQMISDVDTRLDNTVDTVQQQLAATQAKVDQQLDDTTNQVRQFQIVERQLSDQTDMVSTLASRSNLGYMELRVTGGRENSYPSFSVYRVYDGGRSGFFAETSFASGDTDGNDQYQRIWETHAGYATSTSTPGQFEYERRVKLSPVSNHEFALRIKPASLPNTQSQWVPRHNNINTAVRAAEPLFMTPNGRLRVNEGDVRRAQIEGHLDFIQHVYGRHPDTGNRNLIEIWTTHRFTPDGVITLTGRWKALEDIIFDSGYVLMLPGNPSLVDRVVTSLGNAYPNSPSKYGKSEDMIPESDQATSYGFVMSGSHNFTAAVTYDNAHETLRRGGHGKPDNPAFTEHRNSSIVKIYNQLFSQGTLVKAGTVQRFSGRYIHAYSPGISDAIDVI